MTLINSLLAKPILANELVPLDTKPLTIPVDAAPGLGNLCLRIRKSEEHTVAEPLKMVKTGAEGASGTD